MTFYSKLFTSDDIYVNGFMNTNIGLQAFNLLGFYPDNSLSFASGPVSTVSHNSYSSGDIKIAAIVQSLETYPPGKKYLDSIKASPTLSEKEISKINSYLDEVYMRSYQSLPQGLAYEIASYVNAIRKTLNTKSEKPLPPLN